MTQVDRLSSTVKVGLPMYA